MCSIYGLWHYIPNWIGEIIYHTQTTNSKQERKECCESSVKAQPELTPAIRLYGDHKNTFEFVFLSSFFLAQRTVEMK